MFCVDSHFLDLTKMQACDQETWYVYCLGSMNNATPVLTTIMFSNDDTQWYIEFASLDVSFCFRYTCIILGLVSKKTLMYYNCDAYMQAFMCKNVGEEEEEEGY